MPEASNLPALIEEELARLVESDALRRAPSHMRLLRYLVERRVADDRAALRETAIALAVFRRDPSTYDPQSDPIVRVTAGRLRERLDAHYALYETPPKLRIVLPKGRYAPEFVAVDGFARAPLALAVLPMRNRTGSSQLDASCEAFVQRLADHLLRAGLPKVSTRGGESRADMLKAAWRIEPTLAREHDGDLRISVRLLHTSDNTARWVETGASAADNAARLFDRMLDQVLARALATLPTPAAIRADAHVRSGLPAAQRDALERARLLTLQRSVAATDEAIALADAVTRSHPGIADAWASLAATLYSRLSFMDQDLAPVVARLRACVDKALALDPDEPTALRTKGIVAGKCDYDAAGAERAFRRVLANVPHYTSARLNYAEILSLQGKFHEARVELNLARVYDPSSGSVHLARAICLGYERAYEEAREAWGLCRAAGDVSQWALVGAGMNELADGNLDAAREMLEKAVARFPDLPSVSIAYACLLAAEGKARDARAAERACLARFPYYSPASLAALAAFLDDRERVVTLLAEARAQSDMGLPATAIHPALDRFAFDEEVVRLLPFGGVRVG
jgi:tetratricopeptide (TPR) repeat protein